MRPSKVYQQHRDAIRRIVARHHAVNPRVFGSALHGNDTAESDLDILIDPTEETSLFDVGSIRTELTELIGFEVDVLTPGASAPTDSGDIPGPRPPSDRAGSSRRISRRRSRNIPGAHSPRRTAGGDLPSLVREDGNQATEGKLR
ncbi:MAG TPA: nucleotidyltransferase domain-containing protein [Nevskiaceae bacterium]|nr:nucleotidyltransferase domain-containing protein [Nevskiaceae bacterium]